MSFNNGPRTVTTGLSLLVDAADPLSYPGSGTNWTDIVTGITGSLSGSITYASDFKGTLVVNDSSSVIIFPTASGNFGTDSFTVELAFQPNQINGQHWLVAKNSGSFPSWGAFITGSGGSGRLTAFFNISSTVSCSMSTPVGSIVTGSNYLVDINFVPNTALNSIYLNSELSGSVIPNGTGSLSTTSSLFISNRNSGSSVGTPLEIFNTKLYTPRLVPGRIRQNYNALSTRLGLPQKAFLIIQDDPLLDLYPGAAAAYSLRLLNSIYTGNAIRVRRSSDNTEQNIGFIDNDLDTTSLLSFVGAGDGFVTTWYDQSGNGRNATQTTAANQPQIVSNGSVLLQNAKPTILFDGSNDSLPFNGSFIANSNYSIYVNIARKSNKSGNYILGGTNTNTNSLLHIGYRNNTTFTLAHFDPDLDATITGYTSTILELYSLYNNDVGKYIFQNNILKSSNTNTTDLTSWTGSNIGNYANLSYAFMNISEIIIYPTDKYSNNSEINTNINTYYGIY